MALSLATGLQLCDGRDPIEYVEKVVNVCGIGTAKITIKFLNEVCKVYLLDKYPEFRELPMKELMVLSFEDKENSAKIWCDEQLSKGVAKSYRIKRMSTKVFSDIFYSFMGSNDNITG